MKTRLSERERSVARGLTRRDFVRGAAALGVAASSGAVGVRAASAQAGRPKPGGTVVIGCYQEPNSLNWLLTGTPAAFGFLCQYPIFEPMLRVSEKLEPEPALLAEVPTRQNGGISRDGLTYTLRMRPGLKWAEDR